MLVMEVNQNGNRYRIKEYWNNKLHTPYNYKEYGLNKHIMSHKLWNTENPFLKNILSYVESSLIYAMDTIDMLNNFFNYNWKNR